jgi:hypothetical protein
MEHDYPAAHSMNTSWFAVDRDGHVAMFDSRQAGAVPRNAAVQDDSLVETVEALVPPGEVIHDPTGRLRSGKQDGYPKAHLWTTQARVLLFLSSLEPIRKLITAGRAVEVAAIEGKAVLLRDPTTKELERYHALPEFRGSYLLYLFEGQTEPSSPARFGVYQYSHLTENWISGPYGREMVPGQPLHVDQLPPGLRQSLSQLRLDVRFADTTYIQPVEHSQCESREPGYLDVNCKRIRPIPGKEDEYAERFEDYYAGSGYDAEPPDSE